MSIKNKTLIRIEKECESFGFEGRYRILTELNDFVDNIRERFSCGIHTEDEVKSATNKYGISTMNYNYILPDIQFITSVIPKFGLFSGFYEVRTLYYYPPKDLLVCFNGDMIFPSEENQQVKVCNFNEIFTEGDDFFIEFTGIKKPRGSWLEIYNKVIGFVDIWQKAILYYLSKKVSEKESKNDNSGNKRRNKKDK